MATWQKLIVSGSEISQLNNDAGYITDAGNAFNTASFNGVDLLADSVDGILNFASSSGQGLTISANAGSDTLTFGLSNIPFDSLDLADIVDSSEGISLATTGSDDSLATTKAIYEFVTNQVGAATLTIDSGNDASQIAIDLNNETLSITGNDGLTVNNASNDVGIGLTDGGILPVKLDSTLAGDGLASTLGVLSVNVDDSSIEISGDTLQVKASGITNAMLVNDSITFGTDDVSLGDTVSQMSLTGFTGSLSSTSVLADGVTATTQIAGDSSTLVATTEFVTNAVGDLSSTIAVSSSDDQTNDLIDLKNEPLNFAGTTEDVDVTILPGSNTVKFGLRDDVTIQNNLTVKNDLVVDGDMVVTGTASFRHETILEVADQFILMGSGSSTPQDGGIVVQQGTQDFGDLFGFDQETERWAVRTNFDSRTGAFDPEAFMSAVIEGGTSVNDPSSVDARYNKKGNIFVGDNGDLYIFG